MPNKRSENKKKLTCWLDREELEEMQEEAKAQGVAVTAIVATLIADYVAKNRKRAQKKR